MVIPAVDIINLSKTFNNTKALDNITVSIEPGEMVALIGASGAGKTTLLYQISGLIPADNNASSVRIFNRTVQVNGKIAKNIRKIRAQIGFIFQQFSLVNRLPVLINVLTGLLARIPFWRSIFKFFTKEEKFIALKALERVNLAAYAMYRASSLSGGQQQRAAIARTLVQRSQVILADEPINSLDPQSSYAIMNTLADINEKDKVTVIVSLHQLDYAMSFCKRIIGLKEGKVVYDGPAREVNFDTLCEIFGMNWDQEDTSADMHAASNLPVNDFFIKKDFKHDLVSMS